MSVKKKAAKKRLLDGEADSMWSAGGFYTKVAESRKPVWEALKAALAPRFRQLIPKEGLVLVAGAGKGDDGRILREVVSEDRLVSADLSLAAIAKNPRETKFVADSRGLPFKDGTFAAVVLMDHLDVFSIYQLPAVIKESHRLLADDSLLLSAHTSIPAVNFWGLDPARTLAVLDGRIPRTQADEGELSEIRSRYRTTLRTLLSRTSGVSPPLFGRVWQEFVGATHCGEWDARRHKAFDKRYAGMVPAGDLPTYTHFFGSTGMAGVAQSIPNMELMNERVPELSVEIPDPKAMKRDFEKPVCELFVHDMTYGWKNK